MKSIFRMGWAFGAASFIAACTGDTTNVDPPKVARSISAQEVRQLATANAHDLALGVMKSAGKFAKLEISDALDLEGLFQPFGGGDTNCAGDGCPTTPTDESRADDFGQAIAENLFDANLVEKAEDTIVTYKLDAKDFCQSNEAILPKPIDDPNAPPPPPPEPTIDEACAARLEQHPIRLSVQSFEAGALTVKVLIDAAQTEVASLDVTAKKADVKLNLGTLHDFMKGVQISDVELDDVERLAGKVSLSLAEVGPSAYQLDASVTEAIDVSITGADAMAFKLQASTTPIASVRLDATTEDVSVTAELPGAEATLPLKLFGGGGKVVCNENPPDENGNPTEPTCTEEPGPTGSVALALGKAGATVNLSGSNERVSGTIRAKGADLATAMFGASKLVGLSVNPTGPDAVDFTINATNDSMEIAFTPALSGAAFLDFHSIADQIETPSWANGETLGLALDHATMKMNTGDSSSGNVRPVDPGMEPPPPPPPSDHQILQLSAGSLKLTSSMPEIDVAAGQCLLERPRAETDGDHPFALLKSGACL